MKNMATEAHHLLGNKAVQSWLVDEEVLVT